MVLQEALKEPLSGPGEAGRRGWSAVGLGAGRESRKPFLAWNGMFQKNVFRTSRTRASATAPLVILICWSAGSGEGGGKGKHGSPLLSYSFSLTGGPAHSQDISKGEA